MDRERIIKIMSDIEKYFSDLESREIKGLDDLKDIEKYYATSMILFSLLNRVIDLGQEVIISKKFGMPSSYKDTFRILFERRIIEGGMFEELKKFIDLRNVLSHEYYRIDENDIFYAVQKIRVVKNFVGRMKKEIR